MFKKIILAAVALSFIGAPLAQARDYRQPQQSHKSQNYKADPKHQRPASKPSKHYKPAPKYSKHQNYRWSKGQRVPHWQKQKRVNDYRRYGLRKPARGQQWVQIDNQFLLVTAATGLIISMMAMR